MLAYAIFVTFVLGILIGACIIILIAIHMENEEADKLQKAVEESMITANEARSILKYT